MPRDSSDTAFLGVATSFTGRRWVGPGLETERAADVLHRMTGHPPPLCTVLARRGVAAADVPGFLAPKLRDLLPDPRRLRAMDRAADRLRAAVTRGERIAIFADYDVDGAASAALLLRWLRGHGLAATLHVPDRIAEGYGPNAPAMADLAAAHDLIVCVDCGTLGHTALAAARDCDVLVLDHHLGAETLPPAHAVVNPNRADEDGALGHLCAASVVFLLLVETNRRARAAGRTAPDLMALLDLVALATIADVVPLNGANRALVRQGLAVMSAGGNPGLAALAQAARLTGPAAAHHLGYVLGPRITPAGGSGGPISARGCWPPTIRPRPRSSPPGWRRSTPNAGRSRPRCATRPWPRRRRAASTHRWSGPPARAGIPASSGSWPPA